MSRSFPGLKYSHSLEESGSQIPWKLTLRGSWTSILVDNANSPQIYSMLDVANLFMVLDTAIDLLEFF